MAKGSYSATQHSLASEHPNGVIDGSCSKQPGAARGAGGSEADAGSALAKPMAAHGHVNGWREGTA